jgi:hypothetical protein
MSVSIKSSYLPIGLKYENEHSDSDYDSDSNNDSGIDSERYYTNCDTMEDVYIALQEQREYDSFFVGIPSYDNFALQKAEMSYRAFVTSKKNLNLGKSLEELTQIYEDFAKDVQSPDYDGFELAYLSFKIYLANEQIKKEQEDNVHA